MHRVRAHPRLFIGLVMAALLAVLALFAPAAAAGARHHHHWTRFVPAATSWTLNSLSATVGSGGSVTAKASVTSSSNVTAAYYGVCAHSSSGAIADFNPKRTNVAFAAGVAQTVSATKTFATGTYTYFACVDVSNVWTQVGGAKSFTVGSTPPPSSSSSPPPSSSSSPPPPPPSGNTPNGPSGSWAQTFDDEFNGTAVDTSKWAKNWYGEGGKMNGVGTYAHNVTESGGALHLTLEGTKNSDGSTSVTGGALVHTDISGGYKLPVGSYTEARIYFPGPSSTALSNWGAWWASASAADGWPSSGEHDIAEILSGQLTVNYHSPSGAHNQGGVSGFAPGNSWHTYGLYRGAGFADVYWDGVKVKHYTTDDNGKPEILILNVGNGSNDAFGLANAIQVDYVRAWKPV